MPWAPRVCPDCGGKRHARAARCHRCACIAKTGKPANTPAPSERFWRFVEKTETCWIWTGGTNGHGYGRLTFSGRDGKKVAAHRFAYELLIGPVPDGLVIDHLRGNRLCVNPAHLEPVTQKENLRRAGVLNRPRDGAGRFAGHRTTSSGERKERGLDA